MHQSDNSSPVDGGSPAFSPLTFDPAEFAAYVADFDLTDAQRRELLEAVWSVMVGFVDMGFGIHPIQQAMPEDSIAISVQPDSTPMLDSEHSTSKNTSTIADHFDGCAMGKTES